jgi:hypothetical protein
MAMVEHAPKTMDQDDYVAHEKTYRLFVRLMVWSAAAIAVVLALLALWAG